MTTIDQSGQFTPPIAGQQGQIQTALQQALRTSIEQRKQAGLPIPQAVSYDYEKVDSPANKNGLGAASEQTVTIRGTTTIDLTHPEQAGLDKWPDPVVADNMPNEATGFILPGDYSQAVKDRLQEAFPGIWDQYEFGYEPRRYTYEETFKVTYPDESPQAIALAPSGISATGDTQELVMGFSTSGPRINYTIEEKWETCIPNPFGNPICTTVATAKGGLAVDWDIGFRLPIAVDLIAPSSMQVGSTHAISVAVTSKDWSAQQFQQVGLEPVGGKEFLLQYVFFLGLKAEIVGVDVVNFTVADAKYDASKSFATPVGRGSSFPLPKLNVPPSATGLEYNVIPGFSVGIGVSMDPKLKMGGITAEWQAVPGSDASGSGSITYNVTSGKPVPVGSVMADDLSPATDQAHLRLTSFRYRFDEFLIGIGAFLQFEVLSFSARSPSTDIYQFDLSGVSNGQWLNPHAGTKGTVETFIPVQGGPLPTFFVYLPLILRGEPLSATSLQLGQR